MVKTDSTRAKAFELQVQARVAAELKRLEESTNAKLAEIEAKISSQPAESTPAPEQQTDAQAAGDALRQLGRESVQKEVEELRKKLESRKKVNALSEEVEKAKSEVIRCLRDNDRRPLNCWDEVQRFKVEVRRLEENWVDKIIQ
ncbi:hypothetical protein DH86_00003275 [Scytalidium sp. 3C]|nr:hypothetical protein DH86_00003275 [Scytalidium sp. 3C]